MAEITLSTFANRGNTAGSLSMRAKQYIDENHTYEPIGTMAVSLAVDPYLVTIYCKKMSYNTPLVPKKKPAKRTKTGLFDIDQFKRSSLI